MRSTRFSELTRQFSQAHAALGIVLSNADGTPPSELSAAERRLGLTLPEALRSYYAVAGRERRLNHGFNRLLAPDEWFVDDGKIVFLAENQDVVLWGVDARSADSAPPVFQSASGTIADWHLEHAHFPTFMTVMLHWQAVMSRFGHGRSAVVDDAFPLRLAGWRCAGEVNGMRAFSRDQVALCWLAWDSSFRIFVSSLAPEKIDALAAELDITWDQEHA